MASSRVVFICSVNSLTDSVRDGGCSGLKPILGRHPVSKEERLVLRGGVDVVIVLEFRQGEEFRPVVLPLVDEQLKVLLQLLVHSFRLSITLRVISCGSCQLNPKHPVEFSSELCHELGASVRHDPSR